MADLELLVEQRRREAEERRRQEAIAQSQSYSQYADANMGEQGRDPNLELQQSGVFDQGEQGTYVAPGVTGTYEPRFEMPQQDLTFADGYWQYGGRGFRDSNEAGMARDAALQQHQQQMVPPQTQEPEFNASHALRLASLRRQEATVQQRVESGTLTDAEGKEITETQLRPRITRLQAMEQLSQMNAQQLQRVRMMQQIAEQASIVQRNAEFHAQGAQQRLNTITLPDGSQRHFFMDVNGGTHEIRPEPAQRPAITPQAVGQIESDVFDEIQAWQRTALRERTAGREPPPPPNWYTPTRMPGMPDWGPATMTEPTPSSPQVEAEIRRRIAARTERLAAMTGQAVGSSGQTAGGRIRGPKDEPTSQGQQGLQAPAANNPQGQAEAFAELARLLSEGGSRARPSPALGRGTEEERSNMMARTRQETEMSQAIRTASSPENISASRRRAADVWNNQWLFTRVSGSMDQARGLPTSDAANIGRIVDILILADDAGRGLTQAETAQFDEFVRRLPMDVRRQILGLTVGAVRSNPE